MIKIVSQPYCFTIKRPSTMRRNLIGLLAWSQDIFKNARGNDITHCIEGKAIIHEERSGQLIVYDANFFREQSADAIDLFQLLLKESGRRLHFVVGQEELHSSMHGTLFPRRLWWQNISLTLPNDRGRRIICLIAYDKVRRIWKVNTSHKNLTLFQFSFSRKPITSSLKTASACERTLRFVAIFWTVGVRSTRTCTDDAG